MSFFESALFIMAIDHCCEGDGEPNWQKMDAYFGYIALLKVYCMSFDCLIQYVYVWLLIIEVNL